MGEMKGSGGSLRVIMQTITRTQQGGPRSKVTFVLTNHRLPQRSLNCAKLQSGNPPESNKRNDSHNNHIYTITNFPFGTNGATV